MLQSLTPLMTEVTEVKEVRSELLHIMRERVERRRSSCSAEDTGNKLLSEITTSPSTATIGMQSMTLYHLVFNNFV